VRLAIARFHPSSHSQDYTAVAVYKTVLDAIRMKKRLDRFLVDVQKGKLPWNAVHELCVDWNPTHVKIQRKGKAVTFTVDAVDRVKSIEQAMKTIKPVRGVYWDPQKLSITVEVPKNITSKTGVGIISLLLGPTVAEEMAWLNKHCGKPKNAVSHNGKPALVWTYKGSRIYFRESGILKLSHEITMYKRPLWNVTEASWDGVE